VPSLAEMCNRIICIHAAIFSNQSFPYPQSKIKKTTKGVEKQVQNEGKTGIKKRKKR
jgi:hypothetical protein